MKIIFVYRNVDKSDALEYVFKERVAKVEKMNLGLTDVKVELAKEGKIFKVTLIGLLKNGEIVVSDTANDTKVAMYSVIDKFEGTLRKEKTKYDRKRREKSHSKEMERQIAQDELEDDFEDADTYVDED